MTPISVRPKPTAAGGELGDADGEQREEPEDRAAVDDQQQQEDDPGGRQQERPVDRVEDVDRVGREAGAAGDGGLDPGLGAALDLGAGLVDGPGDRLALAVGVDLGGQQGGGAVLGADRLAVGVGPAREVRVQGLAIGLDPLPVGGIQRPLLALVDDDQRQQLVAALDLLGRGQRGGRLGVAGQERGRLVALRVVELGRQVAADHRGDDDQPGGEENPLEPSPGRECEQPPSHGAADTATGRVACAGAVGGRGDRLTSVARTIARKAWQWQKVHLVDERS